MPSAANLANKELRFALLSLFPGADLKLVSEAARCGNAIAEKAAASTETAPPAAADAKHLASEPAPEAEALARAKEEAEKRATREAGSKLAELALGEPEDTVPEEALKAAERDALTTASATPAHSRAGYNPKAGSRTQDGWEIRCHVDISKTCQSLRTLEYPTEKKDTAQATILKYVGEDNTAAFAAVCFERMLQREQEMDDDFCVFYHFFNSASLLYEVQAEIARHAFDLPETFAPLPRIFCGHFKDATIDKLKAAFESNDLNGQDHDPWFRSLAISASPTLFAFGSEAPPLTCFRQGYGCMDLSFQRLLTDMLKETCSVSATEAADLCAKLARVGADFGLQVNGYGHSGGSNVNRLGGQMLQIFIDKKHVAKYVYHCLAFGIPIATDVRPWLASPEDAKKALDGQVRILFDPELFIDGRGQLFHYCGDWQFLGGDAEMEDSRAAFVLKIREVLASHLRKVPSEVLARRLRESRPPQAAPKTKPKPKPAPAPSDPLPKKKPRGRAK